MTKVRCTVCRGAKQVMKLGAVMGDCNLCKGKGEINQCDVPLIKPVVVEPVSAEIVKQVANVATVAFEVPKDVDVKIDGKRAIYKRKTIGK